ncbi:alpha/beta hydrolase [Microbacterium saperdae]
MTFLDRIDPQLRGSLDDLAALFPDDWDALSPAERRAGAPFPRQPSTGSDPSGVEWAERVIDASAGRPAVRLRIYRPTEDAESRPAILLIHGGGMWAGDLDSDHFQAVALVSELGVVAASVEYRLAPEHPYPAGLDDVVTAYEWITNDGASIGVDVDRVAIVGGSAGGGLAVAAALRVRDEGHRPPAFLLAMYPMLDDRNDSPSTRHAIPFPLWNRDGNAEGWQWYLAGSPADQYAAPSRAEDLSGLPPTFLDVGDCDLFLDEVIALAASLRKAEVPTELHVYPGLYHAAEIVVPDADLSRQVVAARISALRRALAAGG